MDEYDIEVDELIDDGDDLVVVCFNKRPRKDRGVEFERGHLAWGKLRDKKASIRTSSERAEALEAIGLSEQDAHADS